MAVYTIIRVYRVPGKNQVQATDRMMEAIRLHVESDYHVRDFIRSPGDKRGAGRRVELKQASGWKELLRKQLGF